MRRELNIITPVPNIRRMQRGRSSCDSCSSCDIHFFHAFVLNLCHRNTLSEDVCHNHASFENFTPVSNPCLYAFFNSTWRSSPSLPSHCQISSSAKMAQSIFLDKLPTEIIHVILIYGNCEAALALSATNRALRQACFNDSVIFRRLITQGNVVATRRKHASPHDEYDFSNEIDELQRRLSLPWTVPGLGLATPASTWARWALADSKAQQSAEHFIGVAHKAGQIFSKAREIFSKARDAYDRSREPIDWSFLALPIATMRWLPHLLAMKYPITHLTPSESVFHASYCSRENFYDTLAHPGDGAALLHSASAAAVAYFCLAAQTLNTEAPKRQHWCEDGLHSCLQESLRRAPFQWAASCFSDLRTILQEPLFKRWEHIALSRNPWPASTTRLCAILYAHAYANSVAAALSNQLRDYHFHAIQGGLTSEFSRGGQSPPMPTETPLPELMSISAPFAPADSATHECLATSHINAMTDPKFLTEGQWVGYFFNNHPCRGLRVPPAQRVRFTSCQVENAPLVKANSSSSGPSATNGGAYQPSANESDARPKIIRFLGDGRDHQGSFNISGRICRSSGWLRFQKTPRHARVKDHTGMMTPFGIVGVCGEGIWGQQSFVGWFWLWKEEWTKPWPEILDKIDQ